MKRMWKLPFEPLPPYEPRRFLATNADMGNKDEVASYVQDLIRRSINSAEDLDKWIDDASEWKAAIAEYGALVHIQMTCHTDDPKVIAIYEDYIKNMAPALRQWHQNLNEVYWRHRSQWPDPKGYFSVYDKGVATDLSLFRQENIPLKTEEALLEQKYQQLMGSLTVMFQGREHTYPQMARYLESQDRSLREAAWRAMTEARLAYESQLEDLMDEMIALRHRIAQNASCANFRDYQFQSLHRFDYTPEDCKEYMENIKRCVTPLLAHLHRIRKQQLGVSRLYPWDTAVDPFGAEPLRPFETVAEWLDKTEAIFNRLKPEYAAQWNELRRLKLLDLESRKGKAPGGYQQMLAECRKPFIFMNAVGLDHDVRTLLHESGHAFHSLACAGQRLYEYRHAPMEFCEVASMGMELLTDDLLDVFYPKKNDLTRSQWRHWESIVYVLAWVAVVDAFQHWMYENPNHTRQQRRAVWRSLHETIAAGEVDYSVHSLAHETLWHRQLHIFEVPFYYIEYGIAQMGALQLWRNAQEDQTLALQRYHQALSLGGSVALPELYETAGLKLDVRGRLLEGLIPLIKEKLRALEAQTIKT